MIWNSNNDFIKNISMDPLYAAICGITEEEILTQMPYDLERLAERLKVSRNEVLAKLKTTMMAIISLGPQQIYTIRSACSTPLKMEN